MESGGKKRIGIIGAGVAGLATAKTLLAEGHDCTLFERGARLGGVWAQGYVNFGVQVQKELYQFPDWPLPDDAPNFTPGPVFQKYMQDYADHFGVTPHIRFGAKVRRLEPLESAEGGWRLTVEQEGQERTHDFDLAVMATGLYSDKPAIPALPGMEDFEGEIHHVYQLETVEPLRDKSVAVVGYGKSATDAVLEAAGVGREAHLIFRDAHWPVPRNLAGLVPFKWGMLNRMTAALIPPYVRPNGLVRALHGPGKPIVWAFWRLVELLLYHQWKLGTPIEKGHTLKPDKPVEIDCFGESTMVPRPPLYKTIREGGIKAHRTQIRSFTPRGIVLEDGDELEVDCVVFGTGWEHDYALLGDDTLEKLGPEDDGFYLYRQMLHPDLPGLVFIGYASTFLSVVTYCLQARWLAELLDGRIDLPDRGEMLEEIERLKTWRRSWMPYSAARGARVLLHMLHYHDELLQDFGANPLRKKGVLAPLKEVFVPYQPADFREIVSGEWRQLDW